jgi:tetratricopeptide (TPR) repeat protein
MRQDNPRLGRAAVAAGLLLLATPLFAQYREYYVRGRVVDTEKKPIPGAEIHLLDPSTSRRFDMKTDEKGEFKLAGLPHATYQVTYSAEGYTGGKDEWDLSARQNRMKRVDIPDVVLSSQAEVRKAKLLGEIEGGVKEAGEKIRGGDLDGAIATLEEVLAKSPDDQNALFFLGLAYAGKQRYAEAIGPLTRVTEQSPDFPGAWFELGVCQRNLGHSEEALAAYDRSLALDPGNADAAYNSGLVLFEQSRIDEAVERFEAGLRSRPDDTELHEMMGRCLLNKGEFGPALEHLTKAREATADSNKQALLDDLIEATRKHAQ